MHGMQLWPRLGRPILIGSVLRSVPVGALWHAAHLVIACAGVFGCSGCRIIAVRRCTNFWCAWSVRADGVDSAVRACTYVGVLPIAYAYRAGKRVGAAQCKK